MLSLFHLGTLQIPIWNLKWLKNAKNMHIVIAYPSNSLKLSLNIAVFAPAVQTQSVWPALLSMNHMNHNDEKGK